MTDKHDDAAAELLIREVDEELRQDQMAQLWKKHGSLLIAASVALVLAVAGWQAWQGWQIKQEVASSQRFDAADQLAGQGKADEAITSLGLLSTEGTRGYRLLADFTRARIEEEKGNMAAATALYHGIAANGGAGETYRNLALIKAAYIDLDKADPAAVAASVRPLTEEASPWRHSAREITALAELKRGDSAKAIEGFRKLADDLAAPAGVRARAAEMLAILQTKKS